MYAEKQINHYKTEAAKRVSVLLRNREARMTVAEIAEHVDFLAEAVPFHKTYFESFQCQRAATRFMGTYLRGECTTKKDCLHWYGVILSDGDDNLWRSVWAVWIAYNDAFTAHFIAHLKQLAATGAARSTTVLERDTVSSMTG